MKNQILNFVVLVIVSIVFFSCNSESPEAASEGYKVQTEAYTFYSDQKKYQDANARRGESDECQFSWSIRNVKRNGNVLTLDISRPAGCEVEYELIWNGMILESFPMMANVFIKAISDGCTDQDEDTTDILEIDLEKALKDTSLSTLSNTNFNIREFCAFKDVQCMEGCDVAVSN